MIRETALAGLGSRNRPLNTARERELVQRACDGEGEAFGQLYEMSVDRVYRYIFYRVSDEDTAEDLTSRVFLKAWEHLPRFRSGGSPFIAWLYTIAHNTVIDHYRVTRQTASLDEAQHLPGADPLPEQEHERHASAQSLHKAMEQLTREQRDVVVMKMLEGLSTDEIAARLRKSPGAVRALQMRALQALSRIYQAEMAAETQA